jgi:5-(carboxyamino)imidazole ribonucleotide mutase
VKVALLMGSDSDFPRLEDCVATLKQFGVPVTARVMSAHRTPEDVVQFVETDGPADGVRVFICAAGGAAHLAGVVAAHTNLPVIGIPMDNPPLGGLDALLATVQMPGGVPVATVGAGRGGPINAALLALRILAIGDESLSSKLADFTKDQATKVHGKDAALQAKLSNS